MAELPIAFDLSHANEGTFFEVLERTGDRPVLVSHALCRALQDIPRNLSDEQLRALAERDGVVGLMALPFVVAPQRVDDRAADRSRRPPRRRRSASGTSASAATSRASSSARARSASRRLAATRRSRAWPARRTTRTCSRRCASAATATTTCARSASENLLRVLRRTLPAG